MSSEVRRLQKDLQAPHRRVLRLERELPLVRGQLPFFSLSHPTTWHGTHLVPLTPSQSHADRPQLGVHQLGLQQPYQDALLVVPLPMNTVPLAVPILQVRECAFDKGDGLRIHFAVKRIEVLGDAN
jgi:hypothetical protein